VPVTLCICCLLLQTNLYKEKLFPPKITCQIWQHCHPVVNLLQLWHKCLLQEEEKKPLHCQSLTSLKEKHLYVVHGTNNEVLPQSQKS